MQIQFTTKDKVTTAAVTGKIDTETAAQFQQELSTVDKENKLVLDFSDVEMITSAGLRSLVVIRLRFPDDKMEIVNVSEDVYEVFTMTGFEEMIPIRRADRDMASFVRLSLKDFLAKKVAEEKGRIAMIAGGTEPVPAGQERPEGVSASGGEIFTWADVDRLSQIIAKDLYDQGVRRGTHVGIMGMNSVNWVLTFFAIQKLGAIALLVNFNLKAGEVQNISKIGDITHLCIGDIADQTEPQEFISAVCDPARSLIRHTYSIAGSVHFRDREDEYETLEGRFAEHVDADSPAVVIFTSGSTGNPKAVLLSAYNLLNSASLFAGVYHVGPEDKCCQVPPLFHILGLVCGLLGNMIADSIVVIPKNIRTATIMQTISAEQCTQLYSVPTLLLAIAASKSFDPAQVASLKCIMMAGASATPQQIIGLQEKFPNAFFATAYGLSEMAPVSLTCYQDTVEHVSQTIGKPMDNVEVKIVNLETGEECPQGESGEITVRGFNTMVCYYKLALDDQPLDEEGWMHTGDLGYIDAEGYIRLVGRAKELIIRGGENIAPGEIADAMTQFPGVEDVKVQGIPDDFYGEIVGASVVMKAGASLDVDAMKAFLATRLAKYKIPEYIFVYEKFPMLPNGKVDAVGLKKDMNKKAAEARAEAKK